MCGKCPSTTDVIGKTAWRRKRQRKSWTGLKKHPTPAYRPYRTPLCGRNDSEFAPTAAPLLDTARTAHPLPAPGSPHFLHVFGAYNWHTGSVESLTATHKNSETFIAFLEHLVDVYPRQHLILVMDNASDPHSRATQAALARYQDRILVYWLPK